MVDESILEPLKLYDTQLKAEFNNAAEEYFNNLVIESKTDEQLNRETVKKYDIAAAQANEAGGRVRGMQTLKIVLIILSVVLLVTGVAFILFAFKDGANLTLCIPVAVSCLVVGIGLILLICLKINKVIKERKNLHEKLADKANKLLQACYEQTRALCNSFDWNIPAKLIRKVTPLIQLDDCFDAQKFDLMHEKYGFGDIDDQDTSTELVLSGTLVDNPFLLVRNLRKSMHDVQYTGHLNISWTERVTDSEGHTSYVTRNQTLTAYAYKPAPYYEELTYMVYGNEAAPKLSFMRRPSGLMHPDKKEVDKFVEKGENRLQDYAEKAVKQNKTFTPMANTEFETLFGAWNRDNETQFRMLFTPLAQTNMVDLITDTKYYGDDFTFEKRGPLNFIVSDHAQKTDLYASPFIFTHYSVDTIRESFLKYMNNYFKCIFFDLAPLMSVPLYQRHRPLEYFMKTEYNTNFTSYENEAMANAMGYKNFAHPGSATRAILKSTKVEKSGKSDKVLITAHSYYTEPRCDYVPTMGGDGRMHNVPVHWEEYLPLQNQQLMAVKGYNATRKGYDENISRLSKECLGNGGNTNGITFQRGLLAFLISEAYGEEDDSALEKAFGYNKENKED